MSDFDNFRINKTGIKYSFTLIFYDKHVENTYAKHKIVLISFETQCNDSTFVDKLFKYTCLNHEDLKNMLQKIISKLLLQNSNVSAFVDKIMIEIGNELISPYYIEKL